MKEGIAGRIAGGFLQSKLSLLLMIAFVLIGAYSVYLIPREEEPQIKLPVADIFIGMPGATPTEMETKVVAPLEKTLSNVKGVEHVMSTSMSDQAMLTVQFYVGQNQEASLVNLYNELIKNMDKMPQGVSMPLVKTRSINDVPVLALTLWSKKSSDYMLRQQAELLRNEIKKIKNVTATEIIGGRSRQVNVTIDKDKLAGTNLDLVAVSQYMQAANFQMQAGNIYNGNETYSVESGNFLNTREDVENLIVGMNQGHPVYLSSIATITEGPATTPTQYVSFGYGADASKALREENPSDYTAVTLAISKQEGADAMHLSEKILNKVEHLKKESVSPDIHISVTRNYGASASEKVSELLLHLLGAIVAVTLFVMLAMGWRGGLVVFLSVPITFALTLFAYYFMDYTLNRITLFALVFVTGIVVDDSIIIAENMHRHFKMKYLSLRQAALFAINEVGNPTILATLTVIAAVLPMAFVSGLMGPYMSPMPIGATIAMTFSLIVALTLTPYLGYIFLKQKDGAKSGKKAETASEEYDVSKTAFYRYYAWFMTPMIESRKKRWTFMIVIFVLLLASVSLFFFKVVPVKMLPFDNKNEFQVVIDMPESATLEQTAAVTKEIAAFVATQAEVVDYQTYVGTSAPISFNGLMRHYDLRKGENVADIQVNLTDKGDRKIQSHDIAKKMREPIQRIAVRWNANAKIVEVPPGPPVLSTIVAEVYGPDYDEQINVARQIKNIFTQTEGMVDADVMIEDDQKELRFVVDKEKAMQRGVAPAKVTENLRAAVSGREVGVLHKTKALSPVPIRLEMNNSDKSSIEALKSLPIQNMNGQVVLLGDIAQVKEEIKAKSIWRKDQKRVVMVTADLAGLLESPVYAMMDVNKKLKEVQLPAGYDLTVLSNSQPDNEDNYSMKWDGEWQITYEVFRDLGIAFAIAILIIYLLIVGWFQNFLVPLVMLAAIPLSLIGIILGHWIMGAYFSATSMIGFIALAGVMVRNSVLLIDFINIRLKEEVPLRQSILEAGAVRTLPILLTAGTVVLGAIVILFDPLFQGLAISLMGGTITSTILTLGVVPLLYFKMLKKKIK
ncbi:efflux RND transporter permease subunit [uncultured Bacteroides sp.]|uniref:efflux RND transporter permease subunit n=1 Tax=uncultured Bacteroides sp. TaxID=162156 RepID=UPI002AA71C44|nr:efflux RND transporter permease subunit [uncultured Bacteroides sp.]